MFAGLTPLKLEVAQLDLVQCLVGESFEYFQDRDCTVGI